MILPSSQSCFDALESREKVREDGFEGKTLFVNIASRDEAEDEVEEKQAKSKQVGRRRSGVGNARCEK